MTYHSKTSLRPFRRVEELAAAGLIPREGIELLRAVTEKFALRLPAGLAHRIEEHIESLPPGGDAGPLARQYLPDARWADPVPQMVQTLMVRSLGDSAALRYVGRSPLGVGGDYAVLTEIIGFQAEAFAAEGAQVEIELLVRLVRESDAAVVSTRRIEAVAEAPSTDSAALAAAFDRAMRAALGEFTGWVLGEVGAGS